MSRYVITQEQLDRLQEQLQKISYLSDVKEERIKDLETHKVRVSESETADLVKTIGKLENDVIELKNINRQLVDEIESLNKSKEEQIRDLEILLDEERKLREYSEDFAKQMELKCAEEAHVRTLTAELCQLQKNEVEIDNKRILELQKRLKKVTDELHASQTKYEKRNPNKNSKGLDSGVQLKVIIQKLHRQLTDLYDESVTRQEGNEEGENLRAELEKWTKEMNDVMQNVDDIQKIKKRLNYMKEEIENRRNTDMYKKSNFDRDI